jgi:hypothetical protein
MTEEQLDWISEQTERATNKALRAWAKRATVAALIFVGGLAGSFYTENQHHNTQQAADKEARAAIVDSGRTVAIIGCNRDFRSIKRLRAILNDQRPRIAAFVEEGLLNPAQAKRANADISRNLSRAPLPDCRKAQRALTDNPDARVRVPEPLYPKG